LKKSHTTSINLQPRLIKANKKRYSDVFSILDIRPMVAVEAVVGESAVAVGYYRSYFEC